MNGGGGEWEFGVGDEELGLRGLEGLGPNRPWRHRSGARMAKVCSFFSCLNRWGFHTRLLQMSVQMALGMARGTERDGLWDI